MRLTRSIAALLLAAAASALPALAATAPIQDGAGLFSPGTVNTLDEQIGNFTAQTGKQVVVVTVPSLNGATVADAAHSVFTSQNVNGILIFIAKTERKDIIVPGQATAAFFPEPTILSIRQSMESAFRDGDFDGGITTAVQGVLNVFRAHLSSAPAAGSPRSYPVAAQSSYGRTRQGAHFPVWTLIAFVVIGYLVLRSIFRARGGPRAYGGPALPPAGTAGAAGTPGTAGAAGPVGPGYGGYGYGPYGGGGGFWSGLLGGLGGAWLGNEMFGNSGGFMNQNQGGGIMPGGGDAGGSWGGGDQGGWGGDAGQADMGGASGGDWSGGGFGGGDFGGGGGFGGGGDSGGGW